MQTLHPHAAALERIGKDVVLEHFAITRQTWWDWCKRGAPEMVRKPLFLLAEKHGLERSNCKQLWALDAHRRNVVQSGASSALPA